MSFNVDEYTISELMEILQLDEMDESEITNKTNYYIEKFKNSDPKLSNFFANVQTKLLQYQYEDEDHEEHEYQPNNKQTDDWIKYEALPQENETQKNKITERSQKIDVYDNDHVPMNREQLGINNNYNVEVAQDTLNPNLKNITTRFINLDSQFRQASSANSLSTDYTLDLSDPLINVLSLRLYSFQIPYTWYAIDENYGNNFFWVVNNDIPFKIIIPSGNYNGTSLCNAIQQTCTSSAMPFVNDIIPTPQIATYNTTNGLITLSFNGWKDPSGNLINGINFDYEYVSNRDPYLKFFDVNENDTLEKNICIKDKNLYFNTTLGWMMGYRTPILPILKSGNTGSSVAKLSGTKYFILILDDYNQNHINNGLVSITEYSTKLDYPSYYNESFLCLTQDQFINPQNTQLSNQSNILDNDSYINSLKDKINYAYGRIPQVIPTAPRTLTQAQIYTINEIIKNRKTNTSFKPKAPNNSDTFSLIPIKYNGLNIGDMYVDYSGSLQDNPRIYFGPVNIERLRVRLIDDMGRTVNLHGVDWAITLISENLYQY